MHYINRSDKTIGYNAQISVFSNKECHIMIEPSDTRSSAVSCISSLEGGLEDLLKSDELSGFRPVFKRWFMSDIHAQRGLISGNNETPTSYIQQPPLNGSKAVLWVWLMNEVSNRYEYQFGGNMLSEREGPYQQMKEILEDYAGTLAAQGMTLAENCARTWIYVRDVDVNYAGMVKARRELFSDWGLTADTHYLASTGINGLNAVSSDLVCVDAYAVKGLKQEEVQYLHALENLSPTHFYGVTFERGTALHLEDRTQILISGTASIDKNGNILYPGDIEKQTERTFVNIEALLKEAGASSEDIAQMIVYIRDVADYQAVKEYLDKNFPNLPKVMTLAPVCRPGWLVEAECIAYIMK